MIVEKELFNEKKEYEAWLKPGSEDLHDIVRVLHSRQIGNQKFEICRTVDTDGELIEEKEETNLETKEEVKAFSTAWESGWQPTLIQAALPSDGLFESLKKSKDLFIIDTGCHVNKSIKKAFERKGFEVEVADGFHGVPDDILKQALGYKWYECIFLYVHIHNCCTKLFSIQMTSFSTFSVAF